MYFWVIIFNILYSIQENSGDLESQSFFTVMCDYFAGFAFTIFVGSRIIPY
jgi:hypothetical protein